MKIDPIQSNKLTKETFSQTVEPSRGTYTTIPPPKYYIQVAILFFVIVVIACIFTKPGENDH
jgi:hypothetical protein